MFVHPFTEQKLEWGFKNAVRDTLIPGAWKYFWVKIPRVDSFMGFDVNVVQVMDNLHCLH